MSIHTCFGSHAVSVHHTEIVRVKPDAATMHIDTRSKPRRLPPAYGPASLGDEQDIMDEFALA